MSKFITFGNVKFQDKGCLLAALKALGYTADKIEQGRDLALYGYMGDKRAQTADIVIRRQHVGGASNDVGFKLVNGSYVPIVSEYDTGYLQTKHHTKDFTVLLKTHYSQAVVAEVARRLRGSVVGVSEQRQQQGQAEALRLRVRY